MATCWAGDMPREAADIEQDTTEGTIEAGGKLGKTNIGMACLGKAGQEASGFVQDVTGRVDTVG